MGPALVVAILLWTAPAAAAQVSFSAPSDLPAAEPSAVAIGDFDGDGKRDLAVSNRESDDVSVLLSDGTGCFCGPTPRTTSTSVRCRSRRAT